MRKDMTFQEFLIIWEKQILREKPHFIRKGQSLMNYIGDVWMDEYKRITGENIDCFYNDKIIPETLKHLEEVWKRN